MTSHHWQQTLTKSKHEPRIVLILLALLRIFICFLPLNYSSYFHEEEFLPSSELLANRYFKSKIETDKLEFDFDRPTKSIFVPSILINVAFKFLPDQKAPSAYSLLVAPRIAYTLVSFVIDYSLYKLCQYYSSRGFWYFPISFIYQTSFITLCLFTKTLSNVPEAAILSLLLVIVCRAIKPRFRIVFVTPNRKRPASERVKVTTQLASSILVGFLVTLGTFNRPTFLAFALVPLVYWTLESFKRNSINPILTLHRAIVPAALAAFLTTILISGYDTIFYRDIKTFMDMLDDLFKFRLRKFRDVSNKNWIVTPYNFFTTSWQASRNTQYQIVTQSAGPPYYHFLVNFPLAFNLLAVLFYRKLCHFMSTRAGLRKLTFSSHRIYSLMLITIIVSLILFSFIPNQELRLLLPLIIPLTYLFGFKIYSSNKLLPLWLLANLALAYAFTTLHEAAINKAIHHLNPILRSHASQKENRTNYHLLAVKTSHLPTYLWNLPANDSRFHFDMDDNSEIEDKKCIYHKMRPVLDHVEQNLDVDHVVYFIIPNLHSNLLENYYSHYLMNQTEPISLVKSFEPHVSGCDLKLGRIFMEKNGLASWRKAFGLSIYRLDFRMSIEDEDKVEVGISSPVSDKLEKNLPEHGEILLDEQQQQQGKEEKEEIKKVEVR